LKKPFERVLLHVGPGKTGTTSIQHFLFSNHAALWARGFYGPAALRRGGGGGGQHIELPLLFGARHGSRERLTGVRIDSIEERREFVASAMAAEIAAVGGADTLLVSSELLFGADAAAIDAYRRFFEPYAERFESLMYLRRQDRWVASSVLQKRKTGTRLDTSLDTRVGASSPQVFEQAVRLWDASSDRCHIRRFDTEFLAQGSLLADLCEALGLNAAEFTKEDVRNRAVLQEQVELVDALNRALSAMPFDKQMPYRRRFLPLCTEILGGSRFEFPRASAEAAFAAFASVNTWLRETRDPGGPPLFFNTDFSDYPVEARNDRAYTIPQLLELSVAINDRLRQRGLQIPMRSGGADRETVVAHIASSFVALHDSALEEARSARRAAAIEERRRARQIQRAGVGAPAPD
jgi:hypothetical protein